MLLPAMQSLLMCLLSPFPPSEPYRGPHGSSVGSALHVLPESNWVKLALPRQMTNAGSGKWFDQIGRFATTAGDLAQLAFPVGGSLVECRDPQVENGTFHINKGPISLNFACDFSHIRPARWRWWVAPQGEPRRQGSHPNTNITDAHLAWGPELFGRLR